MTGVTVDEPSSVGPAEVRETQSQPYRLGAAAGGLLQPLFYGVLMVGPGVAILPWGHGDALALLAAQIVVCTVKTWSDRLAPYCFVLMALSCAAWIVADLPRCGWEAGILTLVAVWGITGKRAKWARWFAVVPFALLAAALLGYGDVTVFAGRPATTGNHTTELFRVLIMLGITSSAATFRRMLETAEEAKKVAVEEAASAERARIARELHDVVSHHVTVMVLQAEGARAASTESAVTKALGQVVTTGRIALNELRRLLGVLRQPDEVVEPELEPQPDLGQLPQLIEQLRGAGLDVDLEVMGEPGTVEPGVGLSAYRIVQEALTNTLRHSGGDAAHIRLTYASDLITVEVTDEGGSRARLRGGTGTGLIGMQERAAAVGGTVDAGPAYGGYAVRARLPRK